MSSQVTRGSIVDCLVWSFLMNFDSGRKRSDADRGEITSVTEARKKCRELRNSQDFYERRRKKSKIIIPIEQCNTGP